MSRPRPRKSGLPLPVDRWTIEPGEDVDDVARHARIALRRSVMAGIVLVSVTGKALAVIHKDATWDTGHGKED